MADDRGAWRAAGRNPVPAELIAQARRLRADLSAEVARRSAAYFEAIAPIAHACRRGVTRPLFLRQATVTRESWQESPAFLGLEGPVPGVVRSTESIVLRVLSEGEARLDVWLSEGEAMEEAEWQPTISVSHHIVTFGRRDHIAASGLSQIRSREPNIFNFRDVAVANASFHTLARRVQRGGGTMAEAVRELAHVLPWAAACLGLGEEARRAFLILPRADSFPDAMNMPHVILPAPRGFWIGNVARSEQVDERGQPQAHLALPTLRTFFDFDMVSDALASDITALAAMGPEAATGTPALSRCLAWANRERIGAMH